MAYYKWKENLLITINKHIGHAVLSYVNCFGKYWCVHLTDSLLKYNLGVWYIQIWSEWVWWNCRRHRNQNSIMYLLKMKITDLMFSFTEGISKLQKHISIVRKINILDG